MERRWITGGEIIQRWSALPFEIYGPMEQGELVPISPENGTRLTKEVAPCLYCIGSQDDGTGWGTKACRHLGPAETCYDNWRPEKRVQRVAEAIFYFKELLEYEERSGVGPGRPSQEEEDQWLYEENKWFLDEDSLGPGERFESRVESQPLQKWFTGAELLPRWDMVIGELVQLLRDGEICPVNEFTLERRTKEVDLCLYCEGADQLHFTGGVLDSYRTCRLSPPTQCCEWTGEKRIDRVLAAKFRGQEIFAYEQTHGLLSQSIPTKDDNDSRLSITLRDSRNSAEIDFFQSGSAGDELEPSITGRELIERWKGSHMEIKRWIQGEELLKRWDMAPFELLAQVKAENITPFFKFSGAKRTPDNDPCLYCTPPIKHEGPRILPPCSKRPSEPGAWPGGCHKGNAADQARNILSALFVFSEVQAFEAAHITRVWTQTDHNVRNSEPLVKVKTPLAAGITGAMVEKRWQGCSLDLLTALRSGALTPVDKIVAPGETCGPRRTKEMDPCLYCEDGPVGCKCEHLEQGDFCTHWSHEGRMFRVRHAIFLRHEVIEYELSKGVNIIDKSQGETLRPAAVAEMTKSGQEQQKVEPTRTFKTPKEFADHYRSIEGLKVGWIMLEIVKRWTLKNYAAAAVALGDPVPDKGSAEAKSYGERFAYHTGLLDQSE